MLGLNTGIAAFVAAGVAVLCTLAALMIRPWKEATWPDHAWLMAHVLGTYATAQLASNWIGRHIA